MNLKKVPPPSVEPLPTCGDCSYFSNDLVSGLSGAPARVEGRCGHYARNMNYETIWNTKIGCMLHSALTPMIVNNTLSIQAPVITGLESLQTEIHQFVTDTLEQHSAEVSTYIQRAIESMRKELKCSKSWDNTKIRRRRRSTRLRLRVRRNTSSESTD